MYLLNAMLTLPHSTWTASSSSKKGGGGGGKGDVKYDPTRTGYDPVAHACWERGTK